MARRRFHVGSHGPYFYDDWKQKKAVKDEERYYSTEDETNIVDAKLDDLDERMTAWKEFIVPLGAIKAPPSKSAELISYGISGAWEFSNNSDDTLIHDMRIPVDIDLSENPLIGLHWSTPATSGDVVWQLELLPRATGENSSAAAEETKLITAADSTTADGLVVSRFSEISIIDIGDVQLMMRLKRLGGDVEDTVADVAHLHCLYFRYYSVDRGDQTS